ncbi:hypothetical protein ADT71_23900 [Novosphingobium sp. ST904]|nr:hypothetical protein ADT71_23900 [Novosphingobium sp. ST904]
MQFDFGHPAHAVGHGLPTPPLLFDLRYPVLARGDALLRLCLQIGHARKGCAQLADALGDGLAHAGLSLNHTADNAGRQLRTISL